MVSTQQLVEIITQIAGIIQENKDFLTELDMPIGDSDHGINMARGFGAVVDKLPTLADKDAGAILKGVGSTLVSTVGGAAGPLYGTAFMKAGGAVAGKTELSMDDLTAMLHAAVDGVKLRGKSTTGEQTMLDAMVPCLEALEANAGKPAAQCLEAGLAAAREGVEATKAMLATKGRASYLGERSIGHQDPGATSFALMFSVIAKCCA